MKNKNAVKKKLAGIGTALVAFLIGGVIASAPAMAATGSVQHGCSVIVPGTGAGAYADDHSSVMVQFHYTGRDAIHPGYVTAVNGGVDLNWLMQYYSVELYNGSTLVRRFTVSDVQNADYKYWSVTKLYIPFGAAHVKFGVRFGDGYARSCSVTA